MNDNSAHFTPFNDIYELTGDNERIEELFELVTRQTLQKMEEKMQRSSKERENPKKHPIQKRGYKIRERRIPMMPECCKKCNCKRKDGCTYYRKCPAWLEWFRTQWQAIIRARKYIKRE